MKIDIYLPEDEEKKKKPPEDEEDIDPGMPKIEPPVGVPARLKVTFYDLWTKKEGDNYIELPLSENYEKGNLHEYRTLELNRAAYALRHQTEHYAFHKNHYEFDIQAMEDEFGTDNENYLKRKPLKPIVVESSETVPPDIKARDGHYRWDGVGVDTPLFMVSLIKDDESQEEEGNIYRWVNQDSDLEIGDDYVDGIPDKTSQTRLNTNNELYGYTINNIWIRKAHLRIQEFGSHSTCVSSGVSIYNDGGQDVYDGNQVVDMVEGIFWNNFNTYRNQLRGQYEQVFKITKEPRYDADAITDPILRFAPAKTTQCEVYLAPRRWLYTGHFYSPQYIEEIKEGLTDFSIGHSGVINETTHFSYSWNFIEAQRNPADNYHEIFAIWDRPPHDFKLPRREDTLEDHGLGRIGGKIDASFMSNPRNLATYVIEYDIYKKWPMTYTTIDLTKDNYYNMYKFWTELMAEGATYNSTNLGPYLGGTKYLYEADDLTILEKSNFYYAWEDLSYMYENVRDPIAGIIKCKSSINSLFIYNHVGPFFAASWDSIAFTNGMDYELVYSYRSNDNIDPNVWSDYFFENTGKEWNQLADVLIYRNNHQSPVWFQTGNSDSGLPHRATRHKIDTKIGTYVAAYQHSSVYEGDTYYYFNPQDSKPQSFFQTYHWVYTPPHGGLLNFDSDNAASINAGRCLPDDDPIKFWDIEKVVPYPDGVDTIIYTGPFYPIAERKLYDATDKYSEEECVNFDKIWNKFSNFQLVKDREAEINQGHISPDNIPYFAGVGLTKAESLIALVRIDGVNYYIWRVIDEGSKLVETEPVNRFPANSYSILPSMHSDTGICRSVPFYGCLEIYDPNSKIGYIRTLHSKYGAAIYKDWQIGVCRHTDSIVCPTVDWSDSSHESFLGYEYGFPDGVRMDLPWVILNLDNEQPILGSEEIFELEQPVLLMTYRERALRDTGYYAAFWANGNCNNPSEDLVTPVAASLRNRDLRG